MEELLPYYERELGFLRHDLRDFAERYPKIANGLLISGEVCEDPHIERMIQSFALLNARIAKRLDDDYPQFTEALFEVMYPHYLRTFPSCSVASFSFVGEVSEQVAVSTVPRGTELSSRPVGGGQCTFRTAYPVTLAPLALSAAEFVPIIRAPAGMRLPSDAAASVSITLASTGEQPGLDKLGLTTLRVFIDGEPSFCAALRDALFMRTVAAFVEADRSGRWTTLPDVPIKPAGLGDDEALIDFPARSHPAYRLLTEYFCFPEKFNFFDIDLAALSATAPADSHVLTLHLALSGIRSDSNAARLLGSLSPNNLLLGCTPVVNLFRTRSEPVPVTHTTASYTVVADSRWASGCEVHAVDAVRLVRQTPQGDTVQPVLPFYSLKHGQIPAHSGHYYVVRRDERLAEKNPGFETEMSIVDVDFNPAAVETQSLNVELTCTNRDLPALLGYGLEGGDLFEDGGSGTERIRFLRKPTPAYRFERERGAHWRLISHLALNHLSLSAGGVDALREMLALYDLPRSPASHRQIGGIRSVEHRATTAWLAGNPFPSMLRGVEVRLTVDEEAFVGSGIHAFALVIERFLALYVHANSFTQLVLVSSKTGEEVWQCLPLSGDLNLL